MEKGGRSYCGLVLRWCNPHLLRGRIVIASRERERDGCMIFKIFYYFYFYNIGIVLYLYIRRNMYNMSVLDLLDVVVCSFFGKECENERSCICMSYIFIFELACLNLRCKVLECHIGCHKGVSYGVFGY